MDHITPLKSSLCQQSLALQSFLSVLTSQDVGLSWTGLSRPWLQPCCSELTCSVLETRRSCTLSCADVLIQIVYWTLYFSWVVFNSSTDYCCITKSVQQTWHHVLICKTGWDVDVQAWHWIQSFLCLVESNKVSLIYILCCQSTLYCSRCSQSLRRIM